MITALIRLHKGREEIVKRAIESAVSQGCEIMTFFDELGPRNDYSYNLIINDMKKNVMDGYFFALDSDDFVLPGAIDQIRPHLEPGKALICQMLRNGRPKPARAEIVRGRLGLPCMILHHSHKNIGEVKAHETGDFDYIYSVTRQIPWKFVAIPLVDAGKRSHGK